jgi:hypothetical protein
MMFMNLSLIVTRVPEIGYLRNEIRLTLNSSHHLRRWNSLPWTYWGRYLKQRKATVPFGHIRKISKLTRTVTLKQIVAEEVSKAFVNELYCVYGAPVILLTDNGTQFVAKFFQCIFKLLGIKQVI